MAHHLVWVHPTGGSRRVFKHFAWLEAGSVKMALSRLAHQPGNASRWAAGVSLKEIYGQLNQIQMSVSWIACLNPRNLFLVRKNILSVMTIA